MSNPDLKILGEYFALAADGQLRRAKLRPRNTRTAIGDSAGSDMQGYLRVKFLGKNLLVHRVVFALANGRWPCGDIDHINGNKTDNRLANLREVTNRQNHQNRASHRNGGLIGATFANGQWQAQCRIGNRKVYLGRFSTELEAHNKYREFIEQNQLATLT